MDESSAAWTLFSMSHSKLDEKSARALSHELKKRENNVVPSRLPPPVPSHRQLIEQCPRPYEKQLFSSDTDSNLGRLNISKDFCKAFFLPLLKKDEDIDAGISVTVYDDPNGTGSGYPMMFKYWPKSKFYVLTTGWNKFVNGNNLKCKDVVQLRMFRRVGTGSLCFVISSVKKMTK